MIAIRSFQQTHKIKDLAINAYKHAKISVKRWGGKEQDYLAIHDFIDSTKVLCPDARHRIFHTMWAVKEIVVPIFGHTILNSDGKEVDVKDMCERDHLLVDYGNKFIPTLSDFVDAITIDTTDELEKNIEQLHQRLNYNSDVSKLLLSPLNVTGKLKSLLITHNSWFINHILPKVFDVNPQFCNFEISPSQLFESMNFELWMDNGICVSPSAQKLVKLKIA